MYVVGGWNANTAEESTVYAYHPAGNTWTRVADLPVATAAPGIATLGGKLYVIGGCLPGCDESSAAVYRYDPATDAWTRLADYPHAARWNGCAGIAGQVVCAGGVWTDPHAEILGATYRYSPATGAWVRGADMPEAAFGMTASGADGKLQLVGGAVSGATTNRAVQYDPVADVWSDLPNANFTILRGAGGCGMYRVGGWISLAHGGGTEASEVLPGMDQCEGDDVSWLSGNRTGFDLAPGHSVRVTVTLDASALSLPGRYAATLTAETDSPYDGRRVAVSFQVTRPRSASAPPGTA
jgi:N-acetylneuraminic acid mutarotase